MSVKRLGVVVSRVSPDTGKNEYLHEGGWREEAPYTAIRCPDTPEGWDWAERRAQETRAAGYDACALVLVENAPTPATEAVSDKQTRRGPY